MQSAFATMGHLGLNRPAMITPTTPQNRRRSVVIQAQATSYKPPSSTTGATELNALERYSEVSMHFLNLKKKN
jgi:hypothetical protein